jgi:hypothetical protein
MRTREELRRLFADEAGWFRDSPLYQGLARVVAGSEELLDLAALSRAGQQPANLLMAATHMVVLGDPELGFARFFPSVAGERAQPPAGAAVEYPGFCAAHRAVLAELLRTRLVQTNEPARATALRLALHEIGRRTPGPVTFLEVGASAGIQLRFDRWAVRTGGRRFGPADAPLTLETEWRGGGAPPDLDALPAIGERLGIDLHPVDARDPVQRRWLAALVWPEHTGRLAQLSAALDVVAADPPELLAGDAIELLPRLDAERLPRTAPLVVFHSQVRLHVPPERRPAFDAAIQDLAGGRRLFHVALEHRDTRSPVLSLGDSEGPSGELAVAHGHGRWIKPLA